MHRLQDKEDKANVGCLAFVLAVWLTLLTYWVIKIAKATGVNFLEP